MKPVQLAFRTAVKRNPRLRRYAIPRGHVCTVRVVDGRCFACRMTIAERDHWNRVSA